MNKMVSILIIALVIGVGGTYFIISRQGSSDNVEKLRGETCSNEKYSTEKELIQMVGGFSEREYIQLDYDSVIKLINEIEEKGDVALEGISDLTCIEVLFLGMTSVSDISALRNFENLEELYLNRTEVSDISTLLNLPSLKKLDVRGANVSDQDCQKLEEKLKTGSFWCRFLL